MFRKTWGYDPRGGTECPAAGGDGGFRPTGAERRQCLMVSIRLLCGNHLPQHVPDFLSRLGTIRLYGAGEKTRHLCILIAPFFSAEHQAETGHRTLEDQGKGICPFRRLRARPVPEPQGPGHQVGGRAVESQWFCDLKNAVSGNSGSYFQRAAAAAVGDLTVGPLEITERWLQLIERQPPPVRQVRRQQRGQQDRETGSRQRLFPLYHGCDPVCSRITVPPLRASSPALMR